MQKRLLSSLLAVLASFQTMAAPEAAPTATVSAASKATATASPAPPGDPFVRDPHAPKAPAPATATEAETPQVNLLTTIETWSLSQADFVALLDGPADERAPYDHLEALAKEGKAKLIGLSGISTKSGQRAVAESIDEVRYATDFAPAARGGEIAFPNAYEVRNTGDTLEVEPNLGPDGKTIDINLVPQSVRFEGFQDWQPEARAAVAGIAQFRTEKVTMSMSVQSGRPALLSTATPAVGGDEQGGKQVRVRALRVTAQPVAPPAPHSDGAIDARVELLIYTLERGAARRILHDATDSAQSSEAVRALVAKGEAQLETVSAFVTKSGQRAVIEEILEYRYPTEMVTPLFEPLTAPAQNRTPASILAFETRNTGVTVEIEPVFGPEGIVDINVVPQIVRMTGMLKASGAAAKYPPQPVFTARKVTTSVSSGAGVPVLLGTMSLPRDSGVNDRKDDGKTSLAYIRVTAVRP